MNNLNTDNRYWMFPEDTRSRRMILSTSAEAMDWRMRLVFLALFLGPVLLALLNP